MYLRIGYNLTLDCWTPTTLILALSPHTTFPGRRHGSDRVTITPALHGEGIVDAFGNRLTRLAAPVGLLTLRSDCVAEVDGLPDPQDWSAHQHAIEDLPPETLPYLTASRYCESDMLTAEALRLFGNTYPGWERVAAISTYVHNHIKFGYGFGRPTKTAGDALREGAGVCRDYAHLGIAFCRAMSIPARYCSGYLSDVGAEVTGPGDFCAWFEAYLGGRWHTFDPRHNKPRIGRVLMVHGRDAADGAMITSFGQYGLTGFQVWTDEVFTTDLAALGDPVPM